MRNNARNRNHSRPSEQRSVQSPEHFLSPEEAAAAEESLSIYCKPVELYNILKQRASRHPIFLQRCLHYKIQAKHQKRIKMVITFSGFVSNERQGQNIWPMNVFVSSSLFSSSECYSIYRSSKTRLLKDPSQLSSGQRSSVSFILPDMRKLPEKVQNDSLMILFVSCVERTNTCDASGTDSCSLGNHNGKVLWGKLAMDSLLSTWEKSLSLKCGHRATVMASVDMRHGILEHALMDNGSHHLIFKPSSKPSLQDTAVRMQVDISAQELGSREKSPYESYNFNDIPTSLVPRIVRLRSGNVIFNYKYYDNRLQKTEVTEDFSCAFCLVRCASFKGLRLHLTSCHDLFNFEFWVSAEYQTVSVSVKNEIWRPEGSIDELGDDDARLRPFLFCARSRKRRKVIKPSSMPIPNQVEDGHISNASQQNEPSSCVDHHQAAEGEACDTQVNTEHQKVFLRPETILDKKVLPQQAYTQTAGIKFEDNAAHVPVGETVLPLARHNAENDLEKQEDNTQSLPSGLQVCASNGTCLASEMVGGAKEACPQTDMGSLNPPTTLRFGKTRKLSVERTEPRSRILLQKRQFFHSHRAQPMGLEQVFSDRDSEDEVDDDIADFEDRRMLDDFVDVTKNEKQIMHLWNSFVRKQRVIADGHIPWACEAFSKLHGQDLAKNKALQWCWRFVMIKLWNHNLLDAATMNRCNIILENYSKNQ